MVRFPRLHHRHRAASWPLRFTFSLRFGFRFWPWRASKKALQPCPQGCLLLQNLHQLQLWLRAEFRWRCWLWFRTELFWFRHRLRPQPSVPWFCFGFSRWSSPRVPRLWLCIRFTLGFSLGFWLRRRTVSFECARPNLIQSRPKILQMQQLPENIVVWTMWRWLICLKYFLVINSFRSPIRSDVPQPVQCKFFNFFYPVQCHQCKF